MIASVVINVDGKALDKAINAAHKAVENEFFDNEKEYKDWAGDMADVLIYSFIDTLSAYCHVELYEC